MSLITFPKVTGVTNAELGEKNVRLIKYALINSGTSGSVTLGQYETVALDCWDGLTDALISGVTSGRPNNTQVLTAGGAVVATTFDASGNYVLSGTPSSYPCAIIYQVNVQLQYFDSSDPYILYGFSLDNRTNIRTYFSATSPLSYSSATGIFSLPSIPIGLSVTGADRFRVLFLDSSQKLTSSSFLTWDQENLRFSRNGNLKEETGVVSFYRSDVDMGVALQSDGDILFSGTPGGILLSSILADLNQIIGATIKESGGNVVLDYSGAGLILKYISGAEAWNLESGSMNWTNGMQFADMTYAYFSDPLGAVFLDILQRIFCDEIGNSAIEFNSSGIQLYGKLIRYNGIFAVGEGQPWIPLNYDTSLSAAANYNFTTSATAGQYRVTCSIQITSAWTTGTMSATIAWNNGAAKTKVLFTGLTMNAVNSEDSGTHSFIVASSTTINISTAFTGATGSGTYKIKTVIEKIGAN